VQNETGASAVLLTGSRILLDMADTSCPLLDNQIYGSDVDDFVAGQSLKDQQGSTSFDKAAATH
jgi:hypothetical protein